MEPQIKLVKWFSVLFLKMFRYLHLESWREHQAFLSCLSWSYEYLMEMTSQTQCWKFSTSIISSNIITVTTVWHQQLHQEHLHQPHHHQHHQTSPSSPSAASAVASIPWLLTVSPVQLPTSAQCMSQPLWMSWLTNNLADKADQRMTCFCFVQP